MSRFVVLLSAALALALLSGCVPTVSIGGTTVTGSGRLTTQDYDFDDFTRVNVSSAFEADIAQGETFAVSVTVDDNIVEYLDVRVEGESLYIGLQPRIGFGLRNTTLRAEITMPDVEGLRLSGATRTQLDGFSNDKMVDIEVSGASQLNGDITSGEMRIEASGASRAELSGATGRLDARASGASSLRLQDLTSTDTQVDASGASNITVNASGSLTGEASGASSVRYVGTPSSVRVDTSGASSVKQN